MTTVCTIKDVEKQQIDEFIYKSVSNIKKYAILMVGLPGSGKTGTRIKCIPDGFNIDNFVVIDVDEIITQMFKNDINCYTKAYPICEDWIKYCITNKYNIILDGTGKDLDARINTLKDNDYTVILCISLVKVDIAIARTKTRKETTGRGVDEDYINFIATRLKDKIPQYIANTKVDDLFIMTNEGDKDKLPLVCNGRDACLAKLDEITTLLTVPETETPATVAVPGGRKRRKSKKSTKKGGKRRNKKSRRHSRK